MNQGTMEDDLWWKRTFDGDYLWWKMTYDGKQPIMENDLWLWPLMEDNLWWRTIFDEGKLLMEDNLWWKTIFDWRRPLMEDNLWWKTPFDWRLSMMEGDLWRKTAYREILRLRSVIYRCCGHFFFLLLLWHLCFLLEDKITGLLIIITHKKELNSIWRNWSVIKHSDLS